MNAGVQVEVVGCEPDEFLPSQAGKDQGRHHGLKLDVFFQGVQLLVDLFQREEPNLRRLHFVAFDGGSGIGVAGHFHAALFLGPVENAGQDLAVMVGRRGRESAAVLHA